MPLFQLAVLRSAPVDAATRLVGAVAVLLAHAERGRVDAPQGIAGAVQAGRHRPEILGQGPIDDFRRD